jgi:hypothetical protein
MTLATADRLFGELLVAARTGRKRRAPVRRAVGTAPRTPDAVLPGAEADEEVSGEGSAVRPFRWVSVRELLSRHDIHPLHNWTSFVYCLGTGPAPLLALRAIFCPQHWTK